jgi:hypothetical protein
MIPCRKCRVSNAHPLTSQLPWYCWSVDLGIRKLLQCIVDGISKQRCDVILDEIPRTIVSIRIYADFKYQHAIGLRFNLEIGFDCACTIHATPYVINPCTPRISPPFSVAICLVSDCKVDIRSLQNRYSRNLSINSLQCT